jgi:adenylyltransferase/sulfurtransferase
MVAMLSAEERERYRRQIPLIGEAGQEKLRGSKVLIAGAGGLGSPLALYCAAAGVGHIRIIDPDVVSRSNLNRQVLYTEADIGRPKVEAAAERLCSFNPDIRVEPVRESLSPENIAGLVRGMDIILDALDTYAARFILNQQAVVQGVPMIHGAVGGFCGQMALIVPGRTPCLACIILHPPADADVPVMGIAAGMIGLLQAGAAIRFLLGDHHTGLSELVLWDGSCGRLDSIPMERDPGCMICGDGRNAG